MQPKKQEDVAVCVCKDCVNEKEALKEAYARSLEETAKLLRNRAKGIRG